MPIRDVFRDKTFTFVYIHTTKYLIVDTYRLLGWRLRTGRPLSRSTAATVVARAPSRLARAYLRRGARVECFPTELNCAGSGESASMSGPSDHNPTTDKETRARRWCVGPALRANATAAAIAAVLLGFLVCASPAAVAAGSDVPLDSWRPADVSEWLRARTEPLVPERVVQQLADQEFNGVLAYLATESDLVEDLGLDAEDAAGVAVHLERLQAQADGKLGEEVIVVDFWSWRSLNRASAAFYSRNIFLFPRIVIPYILFFDTDASEALTAVAKDPARHQVPFVDLPGDFKVLDRSVESALELLPPTEGLSFWVMVLLAPHLLVAWHAIGFFSTNFWVSLVVVVTCLGKWTEEVQQLWTAMRHRRRARQILFKSRLKSFSISLAYYLAFPFIPWQLCDAFFYGSFMFSVVSIVVGPIRQYWRGGVINAVVATLRIALLLLPLAFDDDSWWDLFIFAGIGLPAVAVVALLGRMAIGNVTPSQAGYIPFLRQLLKPMVKIDRARLLASSVETVGRLPAENIAQHRGKISVSFVSETMAVHEEGIDAGGLFRSWVTEAGRAAFSPDAQFVTQLEIKEGAAVRGTEEFVGTPLYCLSTVPAAAGDWFFEAAPRLEKLPDIDVYTFIGRLLGISLSNNYPLGVTLSPPLCRMLVATHPEKVEFAPEDAAFASTAMYDTARWVLEYADKNDEEGMEVLDLTWTAGDEPLAGADPDAMVTCATARPYLQAVARHVFRDGPVKVALQAVRNGLRDVIPNAHTIDADALRDRIAGQASIDVRDWRANTTVSPSNLSDAQQSRLRAFWAYVEELDDAAKKDLLFFITGRRCLPTGGFAATDGMRLVLLEPGRADDSLPVAHTCFSKLELPAYSSPEMMAQKLSVALNHGLNGFGVI